jgi:dTDP-L-rhamnose 4-epimerase
MVKRIPVTGGAGFLGPYVADDLLAAGWAVRALDNLELQVHGPGRPRPDHLHPEVELLVGAARGPAAVAGAPDRVAEMHVHLRAQGLAP